MNVIIEGADGTGKSTLAGVLSNALRMPVVPRTPKPKNSRELVAKYKRHLEIENAIHDRHPVITEFIYARVLRGIDRRDDPFWYHAWNSLMIQRPVIILCRLDYFDRHKVKRDENAGHVDQVEHHYKKIVGAYDLWALHHAHILYNSSNDIEHLISMIRGVVNERSV